MSIKSSNLKISTIITLGIILLLIITVPAILYLQSAPAEDANISATTSADRAADIAAKEYSKLYPIINELPIIYAKYSDDYSTYVEFRIDGGSFPDCPQDFCLKITDTTGGNYELARELIKNTGFSPDNYEIIYEHKPIVPLE